MENKTEIKDSSVRNRILWLLVIASRLIVGATFIFSGFVKAIDPTGSAIKFEEYFSVLGIGFLSPLSLFFGVVLAAFEFLLGINTLLQIDLMAGFVGHVLYDPVDTLSGDSRSCKRLRVFW